MGFEHREQWIEDGVQTLSDCFAASVCGFAVVVTGNIEELDDLIWFPNEFALNCRQIIAVAEVAKSSGDLPCRPELLASSATHASLAEPGLAVCCLFCRRRGG